MYDRQDLRQRILEQLVHAPEPLGAGTILDRLRAGGMKVSQPTVGRALAHTDRLGLTAKHGNRGRELTEDGRHYLEKVRRNLTSGQLTDTQLARVGRATLAELRQAIVSRRVLEREAARLAAEHAQAEQIAHLRRALEAQRYSLVLGARGAESAVEFHDALAEASGNRFLAAALQLIRTSTHSIRALMSALGASIGGDSYPRHREILRAVIARDGAEAERLAGAHMNDFIGYVDAWISGSDPGTAIESAIDEGEKMTAHMVPPC